MHHAFGAKPEGLLADCDVARKSAAVEILLERFKNASADALPQRLADFEILS
jgi:hypothetical protein